jgi:26S proteasome regulatory subunit T5
LIFNDVFLKRLDDLVGVNKDSYIILDKLPPEYDSRVKAMEVDERPQEQYSDIGEIFKVPTYDFNSFF